MTHHVDVILFLIRCKSRLVLMSENFHLFVSVCICVDFLEWYLVWMCRFASPDSCCLWSVSSCVCVCVWERERVFRGHSESLHYAWKAFRQQACQAPSCQFIWFELWNGVMKCETSGLKCFDYPYTLWPSISISLLWDMTYARLSMKMVICNLV